MNCATLYQKIRDDILNNVLPKGTPLRQVDLSDLYGVSRIPIRDALLSLKAEGWLVPHGKAGLMIPDLSWQEAEELYLLRAHLETLLLSFSFEHITQDDLNKANVILTNLDVGNISLLEKGHLNWQFHEVLYLPADKPTIQKLVFGLNHQVSRYIGFQYGPMNYKDRSQSEHLELLDMIRLKRKSAALLLLRKHIEEAGQHLVSYLKSI